jgi:hypothetical protein
MYDIMSYDISSMHSFCSHVYTKKQIVFEAPQFPEGLSSSPLALCRIFKEP